MSAGNSITRDSGGAAAPVEPVGFELPPELAARYEVRVVDAADGEQRLGLFRPTDRNNPSIEITNERIVARREDPETVAALVKIAQHNGWERIAVDGSPEFRQAIWAAATREGLTVTGYEPSFAEQERADQGRLAAAETRTRETRHPEVPAGRTDAAYATTPGSAAAATIRLGNESHGLSEADRRLLLTLSRHTEDRKGLEETMRPDMDDFQREVQHERLDVNREALNAALDRALESPTLVTAFERSGYAPDGLKQLGQAGAWDGEVADAIYLVRSGLHRDTLGRDAAAPTIDVDELETEREGRASADQAGADGDRSAEREPVRENPASHAAAERRRDSEELGELFLHGASEHVASDPRLAGAMQAQAAMERHIGEVFNGDANRMATANFESRQMISDALRRGLDVSVREPTPVRQIEPAHTHPDLER